MKRFNHSLKRGAFALMCFSLLTAPMFIPQSVHASGGTSYYYIYRNSTCTGAAAWAGVYNDPLSSGDRQTIRGRGGIAYEKLSNAGQCNQV